MINDKLTFVNNADTEIDTCSGVLNPQAAALAAPARPAPAPPAPAPTAPASPKPYHPPAQFTDTSDLENRKRLQEATQAASEQNVFKQASIIANELEIKKAIKQKEELLAKITAEEKAKAKAAAEAKAKADAEAAEDASVEQRKQAALEQAKQDEIIRQQQEAAAKKAAERKRLQEEAAAKAAQEKAAAAAEAKKIQQQTNERRAIQKEIDESLLPQQSVPQSSDTGAQLKSIGKINPGGVANLRNRIDSLVNAQKQVNKRESKNEQRAIQQAQERALITKQLQEKAAAQAAPAQQPQQTQAAQPPQASAAQQAQPPQASAAQQAQPLKAAAAPVTFEQELASKVAGRKFYLNPDFGKSAGDAIEPNMRYVNGLGEYVNEIPTGATEPTENYQPNFVGGNKANKKHRHNNKNKNKNNKKKVSINKSKKSTFNKKTRRNKKNKNKE